jgi:hypothetical protein
MTNNQLKLHELKEVKRHNVVTEGETSRHNVAEEGIGWGNIGLGYSNLAENHRHNTVWESETQRHNEQAEAIGYQQAEAAQTSADAKASEVRMQWLQYGTKVNNINADTALKESQSRAHEAQAAMTEVETGYVPFRETTSGIRNVTGSVSDIGRAYKDITQGADAAVKTAGDVAGVFLLE